MISTEELLIEILMRLPVKSLMRFKSVSKLWLSLISSKHLTNLYLNSSSSRQQFFAYLMLTSSDHDDHTDSSVYIMDRHLTLPGMGSYLFRNAVRGLACFTYKNMVRICNLNTRQVVELPVTSSGGKNGLYYFGHDYVHDEYKVIHVSSKKYHVLVLGAGASWRKLQCHIPHHSVCVYPRGITIDGVLYYIAYTEAYRCRLVLMSFDWNSEEFKLISLPYGVNIFLSSYSNFMNYKGKLGFVCYYRHRSEGRHMDILVLEDAEKSRWSDKKTFVLPISQMNIARGDMVMIGGTSHSDMVWLVKLDVTQDQPACFFIYDLERNEITKTIEISSLPKGTKLFEAFEAKFLLTNFWDDIENIMYLET